MSNQRKVRACTGQVLCVLGSATNKAENTPRNIIAMLPTPKESQKSYQDVKTDGLQKNDNEPHCRLALCPLGIQ